MKPENKTIIENILDDELTACIPDYEIAYVITKMNESQFDTGAKIDKEKLETACEVASKYLNSVTMPITEIAMSSIYKNKVLIAMVKIKKELLGQ